MHSSVGRDVPHALLRTARTCGLAIIGTWQDRGSTKGTKILTVINLFVTNSRSVYLDALWKRPYLVGTGKWITTAGRNDKNAPREDKRKSKPPPGGRSRGPWKATGGAVKKPFRSEHSIQSPIRLVVFYSYNWSSTAAVDHYRLIQYRYRNQPIWSAWHLPFPMMHGLYMDAQGRDRSPGIYRPRGEKVQELTHLSGFFSARRCGNMWCIKLEGLLFLNLH